MLLAGLLAESLRHRHFGGAVGALHRDAFVIDKHKVELLFLEACAGHAYADFIAETVAHSAAAAYEGIVFLVEVVIVIGEVAHRHKAFAHIVVKLHVEAPLGSPEMTPS